MYVCSFTAIIIITIQCFAMFCHSIESATRLHPLSCARLLRSRPTNDVDDNGDDDDDEDNDDVDANDGDYDYASYIALCSTVARLDQ